MMKVLLTIAALVTLSVAAPHSLHDKKDVEYAGHTAAMLESTCESMFPGHNAIAQSSELPYEVTADKTNVKVGDDVKITIKMGKDGKPFAGYMAEVRTIDGDISGSFAVDENDGLTVNCGSPNSAVAKVDSRKLDTVAFSWTPSTKGEYNVYVTLIENFSTFWAKIPTVQIKVK